MEDSTPLETGEVVCPDCGKIIAPAGEVEEPRRCQCGDKGDTDVIATPVAKTCYVCGVGLAGKKRLKDKLGRYWCKECADADERVKKRVEELRCPDCGRIFPAAKLVYFQTERVCATCYREREKELERRVAKVGAEKMLFRMEMNRIMWVAMILGAMLLVVAVWGMLRR